MASTYRPSIAEWEAIFPGWTRDIRRMLGVRVKGCRGTVTVRFRNDRYEVVR